MTVSAPPVDALRTPLRDLGRVRGELADEEERDDLHADLNRRAFEALGSRTPEGTLDTWHDIPERITALRAALAAAVAERDLLDQMVNFAAGNIPTQPEWSTEHPEIVREWIQSEVLSLRARAHEEETPHE